MKEFFKKLLLFILPFSLYIGLIVIADPYNYWNHCRVLPIETKLQVSKKLNPRLWKVIQFNRAPEPNVLFGDSRVDIIDTDRILELTGQDYFNFAYPGGTLDEVITSFWFATEHIQLKNVIIGCNFNLYNKYNNKNLVKPALGSAGMVRYILNGANIKALAMSFYHIFTAKEVTIGNPDMDIEAFWKEQIDGPAARFYKLYKYPDTYYMELKKITEYCRSNNINLTFFIAPTHTDLQAKIDEFSLTEESERFRSDLRSIGNVIDYDYNTWLTSHYENFSDPFHLNIELDTIIINALIENKIAYGTYRDHEKSQ